MTNTTAPAISRDLRAAIAATRFGLGARPGEIEAARGDPQGWLLAQITADGADQPRAPDGEALPSAQARFQAFFAYREAVKAAGMDMDARKLAAQALNQESGQELLARARLAATTPASFRERWALFWSNHFTVSTVKGEDLGASAAAFEREAIRPHVFGRFEDLLLASSRHPAMLLYLDQPSSIGPDSPAGLRRGSRAGLNENLGREIMELHTLGAAAGYSQADVTEFARALTGWSMAGANTPLEQQGAFLYRANFHQPGPRAVFGRRYGEGEEDQARAVLADFAASPHTAQHVATRLAAHFAADDPPPALVRRLMRSFHDSDGDLAELARTLVTAPEAWDPAPQKLKTPYELLVSSYRLAGAEPSDMRKSLIGPLTALGQRPLSAPQPNGWSDQAQDWAAPDAIVKRLTWAQGFASGPDAAGIDPVAAATAGLGARLSPATATAVARAETRPQGLAILIMSPEFQRR